MTQSKIRLAALIAAFCVTASANAAVLFSFVLDPATTAGGGSTSTQSGAGRYHLYAYDNTTGSQGISAYDISLSGVSTYLHRTPNTAYQDADENAGQAGFPLLRTGNNVNPLLAGQPLLGNPTQITGFGREASSFAAKLPAGSTIFAPTTSGAWGSNTTKPALGGNLPWLFIAEGQYIQTPGLTSATNVNLYNAQLGQFAAEVCMASGFIGGGCGPPLSPPRPTVNDRTFNNINASSPGSVSGQITVTGGQSPLTWDQFTLVDFIPSHGALPATGDAEAANAQFTPATQRFSWNTVGAPRGQYIWSIRASNSSGNDTGTIRVFITRVPEPASIALLALAIVGALGVIRRRNS